MREIRHHILHCAANVFNFTGYDKRAVFWSYTAIVLCVSIILNLVCDIIFFDRVQILIAENSNQAVIYQGSAPTGLYSIAPSIIISVCISLIMLFFLAAACLRRMRDAGFGPLLPCVFLMSWLITVILILSNLEDPSPLLVMLYMPFLAIIIWRLCQPSASKPYPL